MKDWNTRAPVSQWISVEDGLPEDGPRDRVLASNGTEVAYGYFSDGFWYSETDVIGINVTHWQPLPLPPKQPKHSFQIVMPGSNKPIETK